MFEMNTEDVNYIFEQAAQTVLINDVPRNAIITNPQMNEDETRYIHTLDRVLQGDLVVLEGESYLSITESITKRGAKYKNKIQHCNYIIQVQGESARVIIGYNEFDQPIYEYILGDPILVPSIVESGTFNVPNASAILIPEDIIYVTVQNNDTNIVKFAVNTEIAMLDGTYKVQHQDVTRTGLMIVRMKKN